MDQELNDRLTRIEKKLDDNNRMLARMRGAQKRAAYWRLFYWLVIIGLTIASFYAIQPYLTQFGAAYGLVGNKSEGSSTSTTDTLLNLVKQYQADQKAAE